MKQLFFLLTLSIIVIVFSGCVKTEDLEKRRAEELALLEEADTTNSTSDQSADNTSLDSGATNTNTTNEETVDSNVDTNATSDTTEVSSEATTEDPIEDADIDQLKAQIISDGNKIAELEKQLSLAQSTVSSGPTLGNSLLAEATNIMSALSTNDMSTLSLFVPSLNGVRLSPYQYVDVANDIVLTQNDILNLFSLSTIYTWGSFDGSGDPITMTASNYYNEFIYDYNYLIAPQIGQNTILSSGNLINNITSIYPTASFVEFYFPGFDPQYGGMDWSSLTLVMENQGGYWKLIGIVHGQWTI